MIPKHCFANNQFLGPGEIGDAYGDDREEMGLAFLQQAADEYLRNLVGTKMSDFFSQEGSIVGRKWQSFLTFLGK